MTQSAGKYVGYARARDTSGRMTGRPDVSCVWRICLDLRFNPNQGGSHARETDSRTGGLGLVVSAFNLNHDYAW